MRGALADLFWRIFRPSLADAWNQGWAAGWCDRVTEDADGLTPNPYLDTLEDSK